MNNRYVTRVFVPATKIKENSVRQAVKEHLFHSYQDMSTHDEEITIKDARLLFQHGIERDILTLPFPILEEEYRIEVYTTSFEGLHANRLFDSVWSFRPIMCEMNYVGAVQYRIKNKDLPNYSIDIGEMCGEESVRLIRISEYTYRSENMIIE